MLQETFSCTSLEILTGPLEQGSGSLWASLLTQGPGRRNSHLDPQRWEKGFIRSSSFLTPIVCQQSWGANRPQWGTPLSTIQKPLKGCYTRLQPPHMQDVSCPAAQGSCGRLPYPCLRKSGKGHWFVSKLSSHGQGPVQPTHGPGRRHIYLCFQSQFCRLQFCLWNLKPPWPEFQPLSAIVQDSPPLAGTHTVTRQ